MNAPELMCSGAYLLTNLLLFQKIALISPPIIVILDKIKSHVKSTIAAPILPYIKE